MFAAIKGDWWDSFLVNVGSQHRLSASTLSTVQMLIKKSADMNSGSKINTFRSNPIWSNGILEMYQAREMKHSRRSTSKSNEKTVDRLKDSKAAGVLRTRYLIFFLRTCCCCGLSRVSLFNFSTIARFLWSVFRKQKRFFAAERVGMKWLEKCKVIRKKKLKTLIMQVNRPNGFVFL